MSPGTRCLPGIFFSSISYRVAILHQCIDAIGSRSGRLVSAASRLSSLLSQPPPAFAGLRTAGRGAALPKLKRLIILRPMIRAIGQLDGTVRDLARHPRLFEPLLGFLAEQAQHHALDIAFNHAG